jgi:hypothetical protein
VSVGRTGGKMIRLIGVMVLAAPLLLVAPSDASTLLVFGQSTGANVFSGNEILGTTVLDASNVPITITTLNGTGVNFGGFFNFAATSQGPAFNVTLNSWIQPYSGNFQVTSGLFGSGFNYLSGLFYGVMLGLQGGQSFNFGAADPPLFLQFTTDVPGMSTGEPRAFALSLTNVLPSVDISNGSFADFTSNVSGTASAEVTGTAIPEPMSLLLLSSGFGLAGLVARRLKKSERSTTQA